MKHMYISRGIIQKNQMILFNIYIKIVLKLAQQHGYLTIKLQIVNLLISGSARVLR